jgi:hypothetical protein
MSAGNQLEIKVLSGQRAWSTNKIASSNIGRPKGKRKKNLEN